MGLACFFVSFGAAHNNEALPSSHGPHPFCCCCVLLLPKPVHPQQFTHRGSSLDDEQRARLDRTQWRFPTAVSVDGFVHRLTSLPPTNRAPHTAHQQEGESVIRPTAAAPPCSTGATRSCPPSPRCVQHTVSCPCCGVLADAQSQIASARFGFWDPSITPREPTGPSIITSSVVCLFLGCLCNLIRILHITEMMWQRHDPNEPLDWEEGWEGK